MSWGERKIIHNLRRLPGVGEARLFRSAVPGDLETSAPELTAPDGVEVVVDLREPSEIVDFPDQLPEHMCYVNIPLYRGPVPQNDEIKKVYTTLLQQRGSQLAMAIRAVIHNVDRGVLIHCTAGKDRTGLVVALMLSVAGVARDQILADYRKSAGELPASYHAKIASQMALTFDTSSQEFLDAMALHTESKAEILEEVLDYLDYRYGSVAAYLRAHGLTAADEQCLHNIVNDHVEVTEA